MKRCPGIKLGGRLGMQMLCDAQIADEQPQCAKCADGRGEDLRAAADWVASRLNRPPQESQ